MFLSLAIDAIIPADSASVIPVGITLAEPAASDVYEPDRPIVNKFVNPLGIITPTGI